MKKIISLIAALVLIIALACPAFATGIGFVPSITNKPSPEIVPVTGDDGKEHLGIIRDKDGNPIGYIDEGCLIITAMAHVWDEEMTVPQEIKDLLIYIYESLMDGSMKIPYDKHEENLNEMDMAIRDLFDARWACTDHPQMLAPEGVVIDLVFDLGVVPEAKVFTMSYDEQTGEWNPVVKTVNNGDGTVTCTFEELNAIEFSVLMDEGTVQEHVDTINLVPWIIAVVLAAAVLISKLVYDKKKKAAGK